MPAGTQSLPPEPEHPLEDALLFLVLRELLLQLCRDVGDRLLRHRSPRQTTFAVEDGGPAQTSAPLDQEISVRQKTG